MWYFREGPGYRGLSASAPFFPRIDLFCPPPKASCFGRRTEEDGAGEGRDGSCGACGEQAGTGERSCPRQRLTTSEAGLNPSSAFCSLVPGHYVYNNRGSFTRHSKEQLIRNRAIRFLLSSNVGQLHYSTLQTYTWKVSIDWMGWITSSHIIAQTSSLAVT